MGFYMWVPFDNWRLLRLCGECGWWVDLNKEWVVEIWSPSTTRSLCGSCNHSVGWDNLLHEGGNSALAWGVWAGSEGIQHWYERFHYQYWTQY